MMPAMALAGMRSDCRLHDVLEMRAGRRGLLGCALCCRGHASCPRPAVTVMAHLKVRSCGKTWKIQPRRVPQTPARGVATGGLEMPQSRKAPERFSMKTLRGSESTTCQILISTRAATPGSAEQGADEEEDGQGEGAHAGEVEEQDGARGLPAAQEQSSWKLKA